MRDSNRILVHSDPGVEIRRRLWDESGWIQAETRAYAEKAGGQSSFDRNPNDVSHGNSDFGNFLYMNKNGNVMLDQKGPGCVYRMWLTGSAADLPGDGSRFTSMAARRQL